MSRLRLAAWLIAYAALSALIFVATWARDEVEKKIKDKPEEKPTP